MNVKRIGRWIFLLSVFVSLIFPVYGEGQLSLPGFEAPSPSVVKVILSWENPDNNISTLVIRWQVNGQQLIPYTLQPNRQIKNGKTVMGHIQGQQVNLVVYGGAEPIPSGTLAEIIFYVNEGLPDNTQISLSGIDVDGADTKAVPQNVSVNAGTITVKRNVNTHSADTNKDWSISLSELLRVIQLFNAREYHCDSSSEDGYAPFSGDRNCGYHKSDYNPRDWKIQLNELLRLIQFFNFPAGSFHPDMHGEDGYNPGPFSK